MVNGRCRYHGGSTEAGQHGKRLNLKQIGSACYGANGCALNDAVVAYRTQPRLERLVEAVNRRSELAPDQGGPEPTEPTLDPRAPPT